jgi:hypothetical protein
MTKQAYEKIPIVRYPGYGYIPIEVLPECRRTTKLGHTYVHQKVRRKWLGLIPYTTWVNQKSIVWYDIPRIEYYECSCGEENE